MSGNKDFSVDDILEELGFQKQVSPPPKQTDADAQEQPASTASRLRGFDLDEILAGTAAPHSESEHSTQPSYDTAPPAKPSNEAMQPNEAVQPLPVIESRTEDRQEDAPKKEHTPFRVVIPQEEDGESLRKLRSNDSLLESLHKGREEKRAADEIAERTMVMPPVRDKAAELKLNINNKIIPDTEQLPVDHPLIEEEKLRELKARRKSKIKEFVLAGENEEGTLDGEQNDDDISEEEAEKEAIEDFNSYDDTASILTDLNQLNASLILRFVVLLLLGLSSLYISVGNDLSLPMIEYFSKQATVQGYLYALLVLGGVAAIASYTVVANGISNLLKLKADGDSVCALAIVSSLISGLLFSMDFDLLQRGQMHLYITAAIFGLLFNTIGKLSIVNRTKRNFKFVSGDHQKYATEIIEDEDIASGFTRGTMNDFPVLSCAHKTEFLTDFLKHSYSPDFGDSISKIVVPIVLLAGALLGAGAYFLFPEQSIQAAVAVFSAAVCICCPFTSMLLANYPLSKASKALSKSSGVVLGYSSVEAFHDVNSVLLDASQLFPEGSIDLIGIKTYANTRIDEAILDAASLATHTGSILSHMFFDIIAGKTDMLTPVESFIYEDSMGVSGWIGSKRVLMGNRELMHNHSIDLPPASKEKKYATAGRSIIYLSVSGELSAMFIVEMKPNHEVKEYLQQFEHEDIYIMLRTVDSIVSINKLSELFEITPNILKLLPYRLHESFAEATSYRPRQSGALSSNGRFASFAASLLSVKRIYRSVLLGATLQTAAMILGFVLVAVFVLLHSFVQFSSTLMLAYNLGWAALVLLLQSTRKT